MKNLYARFVLWLIRPALDLQSGIPQPVKTIDMSDFFSPPEECRLSMLDPSAAEIEQRRFFDAALGPSETKEWRAYFSIKPHR